MAAPKSMTTKPGPSRKFRWAGSKIIEKILDAVSDWGSGVHGRRTVREKTIAKQ